MSVYRHMLDGCSRQPSGREYRSASWAVLDTECTGLQLGLDRVIELGIVWGRGGETEGEWCRRFWSPRSVGESVSIHGIADEDLVGEQPYADYAREVAEILSVPGRLVWAWNAWYDCSMLRREHDLAGIPLPQGTWRELQHLPFLLGMEPTINRPSLTQICRRLGIKRGKAHRALDDARDAAQILIRCYKEEV
ncbi:MAG: hypothetical protein GWN58_58575 [Anaerolineae bacterium]|nr:hypothetical protein [Anaerolineae bacterium]